MGKEYAHNSGEFREEYIERSKPTHRRNRDGSHSSVEGTGRTIIKYGITHEYPFNFNGSTLLVVYTEMIEGGASSVVIPGRLMSYQEGRGKFVKGEVSKVESIVEKSEQEEITKALLIKKGALRGLDIKFWS